MSSYKYIFIQTLFSLLLLVTVSCIDEVTYRDLDFIPEGEPALVSLTVQVPDMSIKTRSAGNAGMDPDGQQAKIINDLWIGIYSKNTGERRGQLSIPYSYSLNQEHQSFGSYTISGIPSYSGECYIVAVANYTSRNGASLSNGLQEKNMATLLSEADTWDKYKSIIRIIDDPTIQRGGNNLIMSGVYQSDANDNPTITELEHSGNPPTVNIYPGTNTLPGKIHLRRLDSYIRVNLNPGPNIDFTPKSWQIINIPAVSYLHEQNGNAADISFSKDFLPNNYTSTYFNSDKYYEGSFSSIFDSNGNPTGSYWFDFYQMENKHQGLETVNSYQDREKEHKNNNLNTGWYASLVSQPVLSESPVTKYKDLDGDLYNNNASYMVITGDLSYFVDSNNKPVPSTTEGAVQRLAEVTWTIHLGYCDGANESEKSKDFNCKRNSKYTYNITINGVDNIRLEAIKEGENQPGAEGIVNDLRTHVYALDSHYGVVNIKLTDNQRRNFIWRIQASFKGEIIDMMCSPTSNNANMDSGGIINIKNETEEYTSLPDNQFYNWIQIRPTSGEDIIAHYPGDKRLIGREIDYVDLNATEGKYPTDKIKEGVDGVWYLEDLRDVGNFRHPYDTDTDPNKEKWYTFFIDEYVWEYPLDMDKPSLTGWENTWGYWDKESNKWLSKENGVMTPTENWGTYVGEPDRRLWITSQNMYISSDQESIYSDALYYITQESIQTYYSEDASYGIGVECTNESYLQTNNSTAELDYTWKFTDYNNGIYDPVDGYLNQYRFAQTYSNPSTDVRLQWDQIYKPEDTGDKNGLTYKFRKGQDHVGDAHSDVTYAIRDHFNEYMIACLSRNRDLNNDGQIGSNEIRWYLPTDQTYIRIILGASSLRKPLFELNKYDPIYITPGQGKTYSHYAASNKRKTWAEEFASTGNLFESGRNAANLRCVRNIGQPTNWTPGNSDSAYRSVTLAYEHDEDNHTIEMKYFDNTALRNAFYGPGEYIRQHNVGAVDSYPYRKFKYASQDCKSGENGNLITERVYQNNDGFVRIDTWGVIGFYESINETGTPNFEGRKQLDNNKWSVDLWTESLNYNSFCGAYYENYDKSDLGTWRTPNISELGILKLLSILDYNYYLSCSQEYFLRRNVNSQEDHYRYMTVYGNDLAARYPARDAGIFHVRCVKDVR